MKKLKPEHLKVLRRIQDSISKEWLDNVVMKEEIAPTSKLIIKKALKDKEVSKEVKERLKNALDSGYLDQMIEVTNPEIEKKIDDYVMEEIEKAVKRGELPKKKVRSVKRTLNRINKAKR